MTKLLPIAFVCLLSAGSSFVFGQEKNDHFFLETGYSSDDLAFEHNLQNDVQLTHFDQDHDHKVEISDASDLLVMQDFISSDESTDFNCSGGFCMNEDHFHKKGLTIKRQYFYYFLNISC
tara:strand:+ start:620 stop:979 length:360 start_codon:yes stop_codon:yes gene_type:complete